MYFKRSLQIVCLLFIFITFNAKAQWISTGGPGPGSPINCFAVNGSDLFAGTWAGEYPGGVYLSPDEGSNWIPLNSGLTDTAVFAFTLKDEKIFAATYNGGVFSSTNSGTMWTSANNGLTNLNITSFAVLGTKLFCGSYGGVFLSTDNGISWNGFNDGFPIIQNDPFIVKSLAAIGNYIFAATDGYGVFISASDEANWSEINIGLTNTRVQCLINVGTDLFAGTFSGVFRSEDNGTTWIDTQVLAGLIINSLFSTDENIFAGFSSGSIYLSKDNGANWTSVSEGIPNTMVNALAINGSKMYAGTQSGVVYKRELSEIITSTRGDHSELPADFRLDQNYPNPFNPSTKIKFALSKNGFIKLNIYDVLGNEIKELINGEKLRGEYEIEFDASSLPSGVYFYKLTAGKYSESKKMVLLK